MLDNRLIAVTSSHNTMLCVWDIQHGKLLRVLEGHTQSVRCLDVSGNKAVSGSYNTTCRVRAPFTALCSIPNLILLNFRRMCLGGFVVAVILLNSGNMD